MSQSAGLYLVNPNLFVAIKHDPANLHLLRQREDAASFFTAHEGLRFVLSKGLDQRNVALVNELFYPATCLFDTYQTVSPAEGDEQAYEEVTDDEDYEDFDRGPVSYHSPDKVKEIASLLEQTSNEQFLSQFDPGELNRENVYPWCWKKGKEQGFAFNERHILQEFQYLKDLFHRASQRGDYIICFVG